MWSQRHTGRTPHDDEGTAGVMLPNAKGHGDFWHYQKLEEENEHSSKGFRGIKALRTTWLQTCGCKNSETIYAVCDTFLWQPRESNTENHRALPVRECPQKKLRQEKGQQLRSRWRGHSEMLSERQKGAESHSCAQDVRHQWAWGCLGKQGPMEF